MPHAPTSPVEVAIVGAGIIGLAAARELRRMGAGRVVVLEAADAPGEGSSSRANGGVRAQFSTRPNIEFSMFSIGEYERLQARHGDRLGFHQRGYLLLAGSEATRRSLEAGVELQRSLGVAVREVTAAEVLDLAPLVRTDGLLAAAVHARDGFLDPGGAVAVVADEARGLGAEIAVHAGVRAIERADGGGFRLRTAAGDVVAGWVVNAAGADAADVAAMLGVDLPVDPVRRNLAFVPGPPAPLVPMCVDLDTGVLVRGEVGGGHVVAWSDPADPPGRDTTVDPAFLPGLAARVGNRFPFLETAPIDDRRCWAGLYPETPDHHAIVGVPPAAPGFVQAVGFGGHGVMHAPAAGRAVAELVVHGACETFDLRPLRPERFEEGDLVVEAAVF